MWFFIRAVVFAVAAVATIWFTVVFGVQATVERVAARNAVAKAEHWGTYMAARIPDLEQLIKTGKPTLTQQVLIRDVRSVGDIFRFKLFTPEGQLSFVSDDLMAQASDPATAVADPEPLQVAQSRVPIVEVYDGTEKPDRPDFYAEAYIPLLARDGTLLGVLEVYVDQTRTARLFAQSFQRFALLLVALCVAIFAIPGGGLLLQWLANQRARRKAEYLACFDPLTGLLNRREFFSRAKQLMDKDRITMVCYLDVDRFKSVNDSLGHAAGDAYLGQVAEVLRNVCRPEDLVARFGGDEFVVAFQDLEEHVATQMVRQILRACRHDIELPTSGMGSSVSIGIARVEPGMDVDGALSNADMALYHVKAAGRNDFAKYGPAMGQEIVRRNALETRLRAAVRERDFEIHYQPLVDAASLEICGYEALLRLADVDGSPISPSVFVPFAEDLGLIEEIGNWTIRMALREMALLGGETMLAINLSSVQFRSGELVDTVRRALELSGFPAHRLELEITESLLMEDSPLIELQIDALKDMGVAIAMDDFGTGFSSLSYLWKYGFDRLKIDRSFVSALGENPERSRNIIESVILLGERLDMKITAEGIETQDQCDILCDLGCDILQGYLFGRAADINTLRQRQRQRQRKIQAVH